MLKTAARTLAVCFLILAWLALGAFTAEGSARGRAVSLSDATEAPTTVAYLLPGQSITFAPFTEASAYRWTGNALSGQSQRGRVVYWHDSSGRAVTLRSFRTFHNGTCHPVLVAIWRD